MSETGDGTSGPPDMRNSIVVAQEPQDEHLMILLKEYELVSNRLEQASNRTIQVVGGGLGVLAVVAGYVLNQRASLSLELAWLAPLVFYIFFAILIYLTYTSMSDIWQCRLLSWRINALLPEAALISYETHLPESTFFSPTRGNLKPRLLYVILFVGSLVLLAATVFVSVQAIFSASHFAGTLFVTTYSALTLIALASSSGLFSDLPETFRAYLKKVQAAGRFLSDAEMEQEQTTAKQLTGQPFSALISDGLRWCVPRPKSVVNNGVYLIYGMLIAYVLIGLQPQQLPVINFLFSSTSPWRTVASVPAWAIVALCGVYFIVEELLLQQSKHLWDDIRDVERDKTLDQNKNRAVASGVISIPQAIVQMIVRWVLALILGYLLGGWPLVIVFTFVTVHQIIYELWGKPHGGEHPVLILWLLAFNVTFRFVAGTMAIVGSRWSFTPFALFFVLFYFFSFGGIALFWTIEARHKQAELQKKEVDQQQTDDHSMLTNSADSHSPGLDSDEATKLDSEVSQLPRPQSSYYISKGDRWQHVGLVAAVLFSSSMLVLQLTECASAMPLISSLYGSCQQGQVLYHELQVILFSCAVVGLIVPYLITSWVIVQLTRFIGAGALIIFALLIALGGVSVVSCTAYSTSSSFLPIACGPAMSLAVSIPGNAFATGASIVVSIGILFGVVYLSQRWKRGAFGNFILRVKGGLGLLCFAPAVVALAISLLQHEAIFLYVGFTLLSWGYFITFEGMTYDDYTMVVFWSHQALIRTILYCYLFRPTQLTKWAQDNVYPLAPNENKQFKPHDEKRLDIRLILSLIGTVTDKKRLGGLNEGLRAAARGKP